MSNGLIAVCVVVPIVALALIYFIWYFVTKNGLISLVNDVD